MVLHAIIFKFSKCRSGVGAVLSWFYGYGIIELLLTTKSFINCLFYALLYFLFLFTHSDSSECPMHSSSSKPERDGGDTNSIVEQEYSKSIVSKMNHHKYHTAVYLLLPISARVKKSKLHCVMSRTGALREFLDYQ